MEDLIKGSTKDRYVYSYTYFVHKVNIYFMNIYILLFIKPNQNTSQKLAKNVGDIDKNIMFINH